MLKDQRTSIFVGFGWNTPLDIFLIWNISFNGNVWYQTWFYEFCKKSNVPTQHFI